MEAKSVVASLQITLAALSLLTAGYAAVLLRQVLRAFSRARPLIELEADLRALESSQSKLFLTLKKLSSRAAVEDFREKQRNGMNSNSSDIAFGDKAALRAKFGKDAATLAARSAGKL